MRKRPYPARDESMDSSEVFPVFAPLAESEDETLPSMLAELLDAASDAVALISQSGECRYANAAWSRIFGSDGNHASLDAFQSMRADDTKPVRDALLETMRTGNGCAARFRHPANDMQYFECRFDAPRPGYGGSRLALAVVRDVTESRNAERRLREEVDYLSAIQREAKLGTYEWDIPKNHIYWSPELRKIFGVDDVTRPTLELFGALVHPDDREWVAHMSESSMRSGTVYQTPYRIRRPDGEVRVVQAHARLIRDAAGNPLRQVGALQDVTESKWADEQSRTTEERFRTIVENVRDYAIFLLEKSGNVSHWNLGAQRMFGYRGEEILGKHFSCFIATEHLEAEAPARQLRLAIRDGKFTGEGWRARKGGSRFWAQFVLSPVHDEFDKLSGFSVVTHDITQRKRTEEDLRSYSERLRATSQRLVEIQETERRHLARELHDRVGQNLTAIGIDLSLIAGGLPEGAQPELAKRVEDSIALVESTVDTMRSIMRELRPPTLDEYGLLSALHSLAETFSNRTNIRTTVAGPDDCSKLPKSVDLAMFRIVQEALNNVARHAKASRVDVVLEIDDSRATLAVTDNGVGFDQNAVETPSDASGWGLLIMRERAEAIGARFSVNAGQGAGVQVFVEYRLQAAAK
jgi:PAS domain S-box-containing protein